MRQVRVLDANIQPGEMTAIHTHQVCCIAHRNQLVWILPGMMPKVMYYWIREVLKEAIAPHTALWSEPLGPHALKNVGANDLHIISVENKK